MITDAINVFEELKKFVFILNIGDKGVIAIKFCNKHFYHLVGLHKTNVDIFIPSYIKSSEKSISILKITPKNLIRY